MIPLLASLAGVTKRTILDTSSGGSDVEQYGRWSMVDGRWSMVDGRWSMVDGREVVLSNYTSSAKINQNLISINYLLKVQI